LDDNTRIYSPANKIFIFKDDVYKKYNITASNFCLAKAFCGDPSDNIPGVERVGFKTLAKKFPAFGQEKELAVDDIITINEELLENDKKCSKSKIHNNIKESVEVVKRNWKLMYLDTQMLTNQQISKINNTIDNFSPKKSKFLFIKAIKNFDLIQSFEIDLFLDSFIAPIDLSKE
jgi:5'-3' exonuclease